MQNVVMISEDLAKTLNQYLGSQPFDNIAGLVISFRQTVVPQLQKLEAARAEAKPAEPTDTPKTE